MIEWKNIKVGSIYKYEEGYEFQALVEIKNKTVKKEKEGDYIEYELIVKEVYEGEDIKKLTVGKLINDKLSYLTNKMKFLSEDEDFSYRKIWL